MVREQKGETAAETETACLADSPGTIRGWSGYCGDLPLEPHISQYFNVPYRVANPTFVDSRGIDWVIQTPFGFPQDKLKKDRIFLYVYSLQAALALFRYPYWPPRK